uniref:Uncharacterized protein n=1 Tax=viral metagenome TaxID=1070528 RepID=A0A6H2A2Z2_9ZZZZ
MNDINIVQLDDFRKKHIAVLCLPGLEGFLKDIVAHLSKDYLVKTCYSGAIAELEDAINWADLVWLEWGNQLATELTQKVPSLAEKKVLLRIHSYEVLSGFLPQINWNAINDVIFVAQHIKAIAIKQVPNLAELVDIHIVANGI